MNKYDSIRDIIMGKLVNKTEDRDYAELSEEVFGKKLNSDECRKRMYGAKAIIDTLENNEEEGETRILCLSDLHIPFNRDISEFFKYKGRTDVLVLNGDIIDNYSMSNFTKMYRQSLVD